jgi:hypothetical protein
MKKSNNFLNNPLFLFIIFFVLVLFINVHVPLGLFSLPIFIAIIPYGVNCVFLKFNFYLRGIVSIILVLIVYLLIKSCVGQPNDLQGNAFFMFLFICGLLLFFVSETFLETRKCPNKYNKIKKIIFVVLLQVVFSIIFLNYFGSYRTSIDIKTNSISDAIEKNIILNEYKISNKKIKNNNYNIILDEAWLEKEVNINHVNLIKEIKHSGRYKLRLTLEVNPYKYGNRILLTDFVTKKSNFSIHNQITLNYDSSVLNRDTIPLFLNYKGSEFNFTLIKK